MLVELHVALEHAAPHEEGDHRDDEHDEDERPYEPLLLLRRLHDVGA